MRIFKKTISRKKVVYLSEYRQKKRANYLAKNKENLLVFLESFILENFESSFSTLAKKYFDEQQRAQVGSWDYQEFRDSLLFAVSSHHRSGIIEKLSGEKWFDRSLLSPDDVLELLVTYFIMMHEGLAKISEI